MNSASKMLAENRVRIPRSSSGAAADFVGHIATPVCSVDGPLNNRDIDVDI